jgi:hypothetical protein
MDEIRKTRIRAGVMDAFREGILSTTTVGPGVMRPVHLSDVLLSANRPEVTDHLIEAIFHALHSHAEDAADSLVHYVIGAADQFADSLDKEAGHV